MKPHFADIIDCCQTFYLAAFEKIERKEMVFPTYDMVLKEMEII